MMLNTGVNKLFHKVSHGSYSSYMSHDVSVETSQPHWQSTKAATDNREMNELGWDAIKFHLQK